MKRWSREDYKKMIGLKGKKAKRKRRVKMSGGAALSLPTMNDAVLLARMLTKKNRNAKQRNAIIDTMDNAQMNQFGKMVKQFMSSDYKMPAKHLKRLQRDNKFVKALMDPRVPLVTRKKILQQTQKGGFLGAVLPMLLKSVAAPILGKLF